MFSGDVGMCFKGYVIIIVDSIMMLGLGINNNLDMWDFVYYVINFEFDFVLLFFYMFVCGVLIWEFWYFSNWVFEDFIDLEVVC